MTNPLRVVVFFSDGASSLKYLLTADPNYGRLYQVVGAFTNKKDAPGIKLAENAGIEVECLDFWNWLKVHGTTGTDLLSRPEYFRLVSRKIAPFRANLIILSGFMLIITEPLLSEYQNRILNVHPADLTICRKDGQRKYIGARVVEAAIRAGEKVTRSTVHIVTAEMDGGPIVALSDPFPVEPGVSAAEHQEKMKWACDGPAYAKALALLARGSAL